MTIKFNISRNLFKIVIILFIIALTACSANVNEILDQSNEIESANSKLRTFDKKKDLHKLKKELVTLVAPSVSAQYFVHTTIFTLNKNSTIADLNRIKDELNHNFYPEWKGLIEEKNKAEINLKEIVGDQKLSKILFEQTSTVEKQNEEIVSLLMDIHSQDQLNHFVGNLQNTYDSYDMTLNILMAELPYISDDLGYTEFESQRIVAQIYSKALHNYSDLSIAKKFDQENLVE